MTQQALHTSGYTLCKLTRTGYDTLGKILITLQIKRVVQYSSLVQVGKVANQAVQLVLVLQVVRKCLLFVQLVEVMNVIKFREII